MSWDLNGSNQYAQFVMSAALKAATGGPFTFGAVVNLDAATDGALIHMLDGTVGRHFLEIFGTFNWGTAAAAKSGPAGVGGGTTWVHIIMSKPTGTVPVEYTITDLTAATPPASGTAAGGNLANGAAPGAGGVIQAGRFGTSATEYVDGKVASLWCHASYMNQATREALTTWALVVPAAQSGGLGWAVRLDTLSTIIDATGLGGDETARFGTTPFTLAADPSGPFFGGGSSTAAADLSASATLTAAGTRSQPAAVALSASPTLTVAGTRVQPAAAALVAVTTFTAAGVRTQPAAAVLSASPALTVAGTRVQPGAAILTAAPSFAAAGRGIALGAAVMAASPTLTATAAAGPVAPYATAVLTPGALAAALLTPSELAPAALTPSVASTATLIAGSL